MRLIRWITASGARVTLLVAALFALYHVANELRVLAGGPRNFLQRLELTALDVKQAYRLEDPPERWGVAVAAIDEAAIEAYGPLPWSRRVHAELVERLTEMGAGAIVFDMSFEQPERSSRAELQDALALASAQSGLPPEGHYEAYAAELRASAQRLAKTQPAVAAQLSQAAAELGRVDERAAAFQRAVEEVDPGPAADRAFARAIRASGRVVLGVIELSRDSAEAVGYDPSRRAQALARLAPSLLTEAVEPSGDGLDRVMDGAELFRHGMFRRYYGLKAPEPSLAAATPHFGAINASPDEDGINRRIPLVSALDGEGVLLPSLALKGVSVATGAEIEAVAGDKDVSLQGIRLGQRWVATELSGAATLHWYGGLRELPTRSVTDILSGDAPDDWAKGRVVFVAATALGTHDQRVTPLERAIPGVYIHATLAQNLLDERTLVRPSYAVVMEVGFIFLIGLLGGWMTRYRHLVLFSAAVTLATAWVLVDQLLLFPNGLVVYAVLPVVQVFITLLVASMWSYLLEERARRETREAFGQYLSPRVMDKVLSQPEEFLRLGGRRYEATVLFSDIRGFTTISEALSPEELGTLLNEYMTPMTDIVFAFEGTLDKYIGDAVMAFWGAPVEQEDHALLAAQAALQMQRRLGAINRELTQRGLPSLAIGVGLSSGPMTIGNMGSDDHFAYTALGDRVNLGSRLEGQTKTYGVKILINEDCYQQIAAHMLCRELGFLRVKGKQEPIRIYELIGDREAEADRLPFVQAFEAALAQFQAREFGAAAVGFAQAQALAGGSDTSCELYLSWCTRYQEIPPGDDWDGVHTATSK